ncbi:hypothetical protein QNI19_09020 [Cytophagaceae bacterium DM2B3-1]|uniref:Uncharacterized protein n=1 Tax=Xanthocytophaga flava TaxID=3048013 RepID=A0ABT7CJ48_9BACT|nr:hypothetical protein [Xanthocytophaga flavus]MDJ1472373.1 hypothetical protein [Xanthocytophaga flavus]MDJ1493072.1 hypothetical protein [Xanthocytophaga flavus]
MATDFYHSTLNAQPFDALTYLSIYGSNVISQVGIKRKFVRDSFVQQDTGQILAVYKTNTAGVFKDYVSFQD